MSLAARYPLRPCDSKEANEQKMNMERGDGNVSSLSDTKAIDQSSVGDGEKDKESADVHGSPGSNNRNWTYHSKENELNINGRVREMGHDQAPQNMMVARVTTTETIESNHVNIITSGIGSQRMPSNFTSTMATQIIDLTEEEDRMTLEDVISSKDEHVEMENVGMLNKGLGPCLLSSASEIAESHDVDIIESAIGPGRIPSNFTTTMAVELHETRSKLSVDASTCLNMEISLGKYIIRHDDLPSEKIEGLLKQNDYHGLPRVRDEQPVEILKDFQAENACQEVDTEETVHPSLRNDIKAMLETVMEAEINLKSEVRNSQTSESKKEKSASRTEKVNAKTENTKMFDWENVRREALANSDKNERSRETMDSLDWEAVRDAEVDEISKTIRERGMNNVLAARIKVIREKINMNQK